MHHDKHQHRGPGDEKRDADSPGDQSEHADPYQAAIDAAPKIPQLLREPVGLHVPGRDPPKLGPVGSLMDIGQAWGVALNFVATIIAGLAVGWLVDWQFKTRPWGVLAGLGIGFVLAFVQIVRNTLKTEARERAEREAKASKRG